MNRRNKIRLSLIVGFVLSVLLSVLLNEPLLKHWWGSFVIRILEALSISSIIGLVLEEALLREFGREVFLASVGYVLPNELRPEMRWLCQLNDMCTQDVMTCTLTPIGTSVRFHVHRTQVVKNIGQNKHELKPGLGIDEWFRSDGSSRILAFSIIGEGLTWSHTGKPRKSECGLNALSIPDVLLEKDKEVTIISEFEEVYARNGYFFMHIKYATSGARVTVTCPDEIGVRVEFAHREAHQALSAGHNYVCPFTLLPYQRMAVRFWDKRESATWQN